MLCLLRVSVSWAELPKGYGQLAFWLVGFGVRDTWEGASPDTDEHWCNTELAGSICCWSFGIGNVQQNISSINLFVWIVCTPALSHVQWGVAMPLPYNPSSFFQLSGGMSGYMHLGVLEAVSKAWQTDGFRQRVPILPHQAAFAVSCSPGSKPAGNWTETIIKVLQKQGFSTQDVNPGVSLRLLRTMGAGNTVCFAFPAQRRLELILDSSNEKLTFSLHTHPFWEGVLEASINGQESTSWMESKASWKQLRQNLFLHSQRSQT